MILLCGIPLFTYQKVISFQETLSLKIIIIFYRYVVSIGHNCPCIKTQTLKNNNNKVCLLQSKILRDFQG